MFSQALSKNKNKLVRSLHRKKGRRESGQCLVEGQKVIDVAGDAVEFIFERVENEDFDTLVTTEAPQDIAAVARIPQWTEDDIASRPVIVVLDGVQDPGNMGSILRLCLGFNASLILIESADPTSPKVIRSSVGAMFQVPWIDLKAADVKDFLSRLERPIYRLERTEPATPIQSLSKEPIVLIAGSEGHGIRLSVEGTSVSIAHNDALESLNVGHAVAIALHTHFA